MRVRSLATVIPLFLLTGCGAEPRILAPVHQASSTDAALLGAPEFSDWSTPERLDISSAAVEITPAISTDGLALYFASTRPGTLGANDIWVSRRASVTDPWGAPENVGAPVNGPVVEVGPSLSIDGRYLFFSSSRPSSADEIGACGGGAGTPLPNCDNDIWVSRRACDADGCAWGEPTNLGPGVNTPFFEGGQALWGFHLYFNRGATANTGGNPDPGPPGDIYASRLGLSIVPGDGASLAFRDAIPVDELNSDAVDQRPAFRIDGREIFFTSSRDGTPDIWVSTRATIFSAWSAPRRVAVINSDAQELHPSLSADGTTLYFASTRSGGNLDLYVAHRTRGQ